MSNRGHELVGLDTREHSERELRPYSADANQALEKLQLPTVDRIYQAALETLQ